MTISLELPPAAPESSRSRPAPTRPRRGPRILGSIEPRLFTPPARRLTPATSIGFRQVEWARDTFGHPADPWQERCMIRAGELRRDGRLRFKKVFVIVARQNGKTELLIILNGYWLFADPVPGLALGTSTKIDYARESWNKLRKHIRRSRDAGVAEVAELLPEPRWYREANGEQEIWTTERCPCHAADDPARRFCPLFDAARYKIAASNEEGGRSLTIRRLALDELRQHHDYSAWDASVPATIAVDDAQVWALSNMGDGRAVVLNDERSLAIRTLEDGTEQAIDDPDSDVLWMEWSAPAGASPTDPRALAMANPQFNRKRGDRWAMHGPTLIKLGEKAALIGGRRLTGFQTEHMCQYVPLLDPAIDAASWSGSTLAGTLDEARGRLAMCLEVSPEMDHVALYVAAVLSDDRARPEWVADWAGPTAVERARRELPAYVARIRPRKFGWFPDGPATALAAQLRKSGRGWPPAGTEIEEIVAERSSVCMGFAASVLAGAVVHAPDPLIDTQTAGATRKWSGDRWVFSRAAGPVTAVYAGAGAVHLARSLPRPRMVSRRAHGASSR